MAVPVTRVLNLFLLFHKCGNNYTANVHRLCPEVAYREDFIKQRKSLQMASPDLTNVRCRNFGPPQLKRFGLLQNADNRFLVFTRHPASFILSAAAYHLRGNERWARSKPQPHLGGQTMTDALRNAETEDDRQIAVMTHFRFIYERQAALMRFADDKRFLRVRVEELFQTTDHAYFLKIAEHLRLATVKPFVKALEGASPSFRAELPSHSTGAFREADPLARFGPRAREFYDTHYGNLAMTLGYQATLAAAGASPTAAQLSPRMSSGE